MTSTQVYQLYIRAEVETVFQALLDPEFTRRYFYGTAYTEPPRAGAPYLFALPDGSPAVADPTLSRPVMTDPGRDPE